MPEQAAAANTRPVELANISPAPVSNDAGANSQISNTSSTSVTSQTVSPGKKLLRTFAKLIRSNKGKIVGAIWGVVMFVLVYSLTTKQYISQLHSEGFASDETELTKTSVTTTQMAVYYTWKYDICPKELARNISNQDCEKALQEPTPKPRWPFSSNSAKELSVRRETMMSEDTGASSDIMLILINLAETVKKRMPLWLFWQLLRDEAAQHLFDARYGLLFLVIGIFQERLSTSFRWPSWFRFPIAISYWWIGRLLTDDVAYHLIPPVAVILFPSILRWMLVRDISDIYHEFEMAYLRARRDMV